MNTNVSFERCDVGRVRHRRRSAHQCLATLALLGAWAVLLSAQTVNPAPPGKLAPRPLYRDPPFDAPTDPVLCFNAESNKWFMYYTQRRATAADAQGVT